MNLRRISWLTALTLMLVVVLAACGGGGSQPSASGKTINVDATEFAFNPNAYTGQVGEPLTFKVTNKGTVDHTFVIMSQDGSKELAKLEIKVGASSTLNFTPTEAGTYPVECDIAGHKEAGMVGTLTVK
jgi:uncharacterized cupredoxin-like copper-binding protein